MRFLFVASLHHPEQLLQAWEAPPPAEPRPLFPPSMAQYHLAASLRKRGHDVDVFYRNLPGGRPDAAPQLRRQHYSDAITPRKLITAAANRLPARFNPQKRRRNAQLLEKARASRPDVLYLVGDNTIIYAETLAQIKAETGCRVVYASGTSPIVFAHAIEREAARLYDLVLVNDLYHGKQWEELGAPWVINQPIAAIAPDFHRAYPLSDDDRARYTCDVAFVGTLLPDHLYHRRAEALLALRDFDLGIWSVHDVPAGLRAYWRGPALGADMMRILSAAKLIVNIHGDFMRYGGNMRLFEAASVGVCQIADDLPGVRQWFTPGENILTFDSIPQLAETVQRALSDEGLRAQIAENARAHVVAHHTYDHRATQIEHLLTEEPSHEPG